MSLTVKDLVDQLRTMPVGSLQEAGRRVRGEYSSAADDVAWWRATVNVERVIRSQRRRVAAATASSVASCAVKHAAHRGGLAPDDPDVIAVGRAASDLAGALIAGQAASAETHYFMDRLGYTFPV